MGKRINGESFQDSQIASHALRDAQRNPLCIPKSKDDVAFPKEFVLAKRNLVPRNAERWVPGTEGKEYRKIERVSCGGHANDAAIVSPKPHIHCVKQWSGAPGLPVWFRLRTEMFG